MVRTKVLYFQMPNNFCGRHFCGNCDIFRENYEIPILGRFLGMRELFPLSENSEKNHVHLGGLTTAFPQTHYLNFQKNHFSLHPTVQCTFSIGIDQF